MSRIKTFLKRSYGSIPDLHWWHYAAFRLGSFWIAYFCTIAGLFLILTLVGVTLGLAGVFILVPLSVLIAIRISGQISEKYKDKEP